MMTRAAVAIIVEENRILVCQRRKDSRYGLKWEFPGGKVEEGESILDCLRRELREELSIDIENYDRSETLVSQYPDGGEFEVTFCFVSRTVGIPQNGVFEQIRWVSLTELRVMDILDGNRTLVASLREDDLIPRTT